MLTQTLSFPGILHPTALPSDVKLVAPTDSQLPLDQQHFLLSIPWDDSYTSSVPPEFRNFFLAVLPFLHVRTTDVHTAICLGFLDQFLSTFPQESVNRNVVALALTLHDSGWSRLSEAEVAQSLGVSGLALTKEAIGPKEKHAQEGERIARDLLATFPFDFALTEAEKDLIYQCVLFHDKPWGLAQTGQDAPLEALIVADLDHLWSFTPECFWLDTVRKGVEPQQYAENLANDLDDYFLTATGKSMARTMLNQRNSEVLELKKNS